MDSTAPPPHQTAQHAESDRPARFPFLPEGQRYEAAHLLYAAGCAFCIWGEDALIAYGVPTVVFELYLMVADPTVAARPLLEHGYIWKSGGQIMPVPEFATKLGHPNCELVQDVVLLSAAEWSFEMSKTTPAGLPHLNDLIDAMMSRWTDECSNELQTHLAVLISYCYLYVDGVKTNEYAVELSLENRQLHFDLIDGPASGNLVYGKCRLHYSAVRDRIRRGELLPTGKSDFALFADEEASASQSDMTMD